MRDLVMMVIGATLMALATMFVLTYAMPTMKVYDDEQIDTFNARWMPLLPEIRTQLRSDPPHCIWYACRVV